MGAEAKGDRASQGPVWIKRYANRKLYDLAARRYITLEGVARLVEAGHDVRVLDNPTGQDVTALIFSQIIVEQARERPEDLSQALLASVIRAKGEVLALLERLLGLSTALPALMEEISIKPANGGQSGADVNPILRLLDIPAREDVLRLIHQIDRLSARLDDMVEGVGEPGHIGPKHSE